MILQSLIDFYDQKSAVGNPNYAPVGMELKRIHYILILSHNGLLIDIERTTAKLFVVKSRARIGKNAPNIANQMWDSIGYVTGYTSDPQKQTAAIKQYTAFTTEVAEIHQKYPDNSSFTAVYSFFDKHFSALAVHPLWSEIISKPGHNLSFRLLGENLLASQQPELLSQQIPNGDIEQCLITGEKRPIARIHPKLYLYGGAPTGCKLISFADNSGYDSYEKKAGENAPVSIEMTERYAAALVGLLQPESTNKFAVNHLSLIFFTLPDSDFAQLFRELSDPSVNCDRAKAYEALMQYSEDKQEQDFVLIALTPNTTRIAVRLFLRIKVKEVAFNIRRFYEETEMLLATQPPEKGSLLTPLFVASPQDSIDKITPQTTVEYLKAIISGSPVPKEIQYNTLKQIKGQKEVNPIAAGMLRCILNRNKTLNMPQTPMNLEKEHPNIGYQLGRLFAILERSQVASNPGITYTICDAYYTIASVTPGSIFNRLIGLSTNYFRRISSPGTAIFLRKQLDEVIRMIETSGIPLRLSLDDQSRFAIGYLHQRQTYFIKNTNKDEHDC